MVQAAVVAGPVAAGATRTPAVVPEAALVMAVAVVVAAGPAEKNKEISYAAYI